jgi:hypothetical protein
MWVLMNLFVDCLEENLEEVEEESEEQSEEKRIWSVLTP